MLRLRWAPSTACPMLVAACLVQCASCGGGLSNGASQDGGGDASVVETGVADGPSAESQSVDGPALPPAGDAGDRASDGAGPCSPGATQCVGDGVQTCLPNGTWSAPWACATGSCALGFCAGATTTGPSCPVNDPTRCGANSESCCTSLEVPSGTYYRTYANSGSGPTGNADPATVSGFRLDKYLVTVGRYRQFVQAVLPPDGGPGWTPPAGSGKHDHLNGGQGLVNSGHAGTYETGWLASDNGNVVPTNPRAGTCTLNGSWTDVAGSQENLPINCVNWWEAYAFCIWDEGFLPSEVEWEYAAAGGSQLREYPWGTTAPGAASEYAIYGCYYPTGMAICTGSGTVMNIAPVGTATSGAGRWGQVDLEGDVSEWILDWYAPYANPCTDCAYLNGPLSACSISSCGATRALRGTDYSYPDPTALLAPLRNQGTPFRDGSIGFRCARSP